MGCADKIAYYVVTDDDNVPKLFMGKKVYLLREVYSEINKYQVVVAMKPESAEEVIEKLIEYVPKRIIRFPREHFKTVTNYNDRILSVLELLPVDHRKIFVDCFDGKGYQCNCKYIAEYIIRNNLPYEIVWNLEKDESDDIPSSVKIVKRNTQEYLREIYTSYVVICNDGVRDLRRDSKIKQYVINTWHGSGPFKRDYLAVKSEKNNDDLKKRMLDEYGRVDLFLSNCLINSEKYREAFLYNGEIMECGAPRNDVLFKRKGIATKVKKKLGISLKKKIVMYAPTYRDNVEKSFSTYNLDFKRIISSLDKKFGSNFTVIYRYHHMLYGELNHSNTIAEGYDVTLYPDVMELLIASDVLITDYSSIMWDFSLMKRPVFLYHNDINDYKRGFYCNPEEWPYPRAKSEEDMCNIIEDFDTEKYESDLELFFCKYRSYDDGKATERVVNRIIEVIDHPKKYGKE